MSPFETKFHVRPHFFGEKERQLVEYGALSASAFRFDSGVCGLALSNELGRLITLPFQGQQIWSSAFRGRDMTMVSMFDEPQPTDKYLETYGSFLVHCGATAMGGPSAGDTHPLHGELPNAPYQTAFLVVGSDQVGEYVGVGGAFLRIFTPSQGTLNGWRNWLETQQGITCLIPNRLLTPKWCFS